MRHFIWMSFFSLSCGGTKGLGGACTNTNNCSNGLFCIEQKCEPEGTTPGSAVTLSPTSAEAFTGGSVTFTATPAAKFHVEENNGGTVTAAGVYTAPNAPGTYHVIAANAADPAKTATATISVYAALAITTQNPALVVQAQTTLQINLSGVTIAWSIDPASGATIDQNGTLTAGTVAGAFQVSAAASFAPQQPATVMVSIAPLLQQIAPEEVAANDTMTLTGVGFGTQKGSVNFGSNSGTVTAWNATTIHVTVPASGVGQPVSVTVGGVQSNSIAQWPSASFPLAASAAVGFLAGVSDGKGGALFVTVGTDLKTVAFYDVDGTGVINPTQPTFTAANSVGSGRAFVGDGNGGAFFVYAFSAGAGEESLSFTQVSNALALSTTDKTVLASLSGATGDPMIAADGNGGAFVAQNVAGNTAFQHVDSAGNSALSSSGQTQTQHWFAVLPSSVAGSVLALASGTNSISSLLVSSTGGTRSGDPKSLGTLTILSGTSPIAVSDNAGGAYVLWIDTAGTPAGHVQRINATSNSVFSTPVPQTCTDAGSTWPVQGDSSIVASANASGDLVMLWIVTCDESGTWEDYPRKMTANGTLSWTGVARTNAGDDIEPPIAATNDGGLFVTLSSVTPPKIEAQLVTSAGDFAFGPSQTTSTSMTVTSGSDNYDYLCVVPDAGGGAILGWILNGTSVIQGVGSSGAL